VGSGREAHGKENPRKLYAVGLRTEPASLVRGSSRRITIMRFRPANIRVINRRNSRLDRDFRCLTRKDHRVREGEKEKEKKQEIALDRSFHISAFVAFHALPLERQSSKSASPKRIISDLAKQAFSAKPRQANQLPR